MAISRRQNKPGLGLGIRNAEYPAYYIMPDYASQVSPEDRWNIVAYIRALQLSQSATMADVPQGQRIPSEAPQFREPGSGATLPVVRFFPALLTAGARASGKARRVV